MPLVPLNRDGKIQLVVLPAGASARDQELAAAENDRRVEIFERRQYAEGEQYDAMNAAHQAATCGDQVRLPEHERIHAYSVQIGDSIEFLVTQLSEAFTMEADAPDVQTIIENALHASDQFSGDNEDDDIVVDLVLRDAMIAMDVPCFIRWDPIAETAYVECWESEHVQFDYAKRGMLERVQRTEVVWVANERGDDRQVLERVVYQISTNEFGEAECQAETFWDDEPEPVGTEWLGVPFIPWCLVKVKRKKLRGTRGESLLTGQIMETADRYNANEQNSYLIARYNSHANLAVVGDMANLKIESQGSVAKDIADVLSFPGGTGVFPIALPTDPSMIEHQRGVLAEALYNSFGLTRVEPDTIGGLGSVSGYALEILNRKTEGTFRGIRREFTSSFKVMLAMVLDMTAYRTTARTVALVDEQIVDVEVTADGDLIVNGAPVVDGLALVTGAFWEVDPMAVFPNRAIEITMGSGYIVSDVMVRDDFTAGLISRREALRERAFDAEDITQIEQEIEEEKAASAPPETSPFGNGAIPGLAQGNGSGQQQAAGTPNGTKAGATVGQ